jgi:hypothetical protein
MKTRQRCPAACPGPTVEQSELEAVARDKHRSLHSPRTWVRQLRDLVDYVGLLRIFAAKDHCPAILQRCCPGTARRLR